MNALTSFQDIVEESMHLNLYQKLVAQLNKDFQFANISLEFHESILPTSLKLMLQETVYKLMHNRFADYLNLLYIVDVSEEKIKQLESHNLTQLSENVVFLILQREWQKVWYKKVWSNKSSQKNTLTNGTQGSA